MIEQREAGAVGSRQRGNQPVLEVRLGTGACEPIRKFSIDLRHPFQSEFLDVSPLAPDQNLFEIDSPLPNQSETFVRSLLLGLFQEA